MLALKMWLFSTSKHSYRLRRLAFAVVYFLNQNLKWGKELKIESKFQLNWTNYHGGIAIFNSKQSSVILPSRIWTAKMDAVHRFQSCSVCGSLVRTRYRRFRGEWVNLVEVKNGDVWNLPATKGVERANALNGTELKVSMNMKFVIRIR